MQIKSNYPLSQVTTLQIGGPAKKFVEVSSNEELTKAINFAKANNLNYLVIGEGSNLLVSDKGVDKLIIKNSITGIASQGSTLRVQSGTVLQELVDFSIKYGLAGLQKLTGIPGTVGGAIYGNAGAYGQTISDHIVEVTVLNPSTVIPAQGCGFNYRDSNFKRNHHIILEVTFQFEKSDPQIMKAEAKEVLSKRLVKYPPGIKCPGSFFKNIVADTLSKEILDKIPKKAIIYGKLPAGYLLEQVGAKGNSLDGIYIADYHANLFINNDHGNAQAFHDLAKKYAEKVYEKYGIKLEPEVQLINLPPL
ncbi:UDP-N-acetylmuramate dehydrogenase [Candidatus Daviesbacteria bacterium]|nr:UDP-N-acetylmuramate dehydrogenase [Candidatus Daviesbacteria bacterium]